MEQENKEQPIGYHLTTIPKGELGKLSKIKEEYLELVDAEKQGIKIMVGVELGDLYGAIEEYAKSQGLTMDDLKAFSDVTKRVFANGRR